jgi:GTP-dependent phosphoenolpyruvate carboxykinase
MEVIRIPGYTEEEKLNIALRYLLPKQLKAHGLEPGELKLGEAALNELLSVDPEALRGQLSQVEEFLAKFGDRLPDELRGQFESLKTRLR